MAKLIEIYASLASYSYKAWAVKAAVNHGASKLTGTKTDQIVKFLLEDSLVQSVLAEPGDYRVFQIRRSSQEAIHLFQNRYRWEGGNETALMVGILTARFRKSRIQQLDLFDAQDPDISLIGRLSGL